MTLDCTAVPKVTLTLSLGGLSMKLITEDFSQVALPNETGQPQQLRCVLYTLTPGEPYDGEFHSISVQPLVP